MSERLAPTRRDRYSWSCLISTRWHDNDAYGHVNNVVYYSFFDSAVNRRLVESGALDIHSSASVGLVVETRCAYFSPIAFPTNVEVAVRVNRLGTSSVTYELAVFAEGAETASAVGSFTHVYVDRKSNRPVPIPAAVRASLESLYVTGSISE